SIAEDSLETLIQTRPPIPEGSLREEYAAPVWVKPFLWLGVAYSAVGLILSLYVHIGALRGRQVLPEAFFFALHIGIFVVWFPVVFLAKELSKGVQQKQDFWRGVLKGAPGWMLYMVYGFGAYAVVNFAIFLLHSPAKHVGSSGPSLVEWRGFSGHWMVFYSAAMAVLYSAQTMGNLSALRRSLSAIIVRRRHSAGPSIIDSWLKNFHFRQARRLTPILVLQPNRWHRGHCQKKPPFTTNIASTCCIHDGA